MFPGKFYGTQERSMESKRKCKAALPKVDYGDNETDYSVKDFYLSSQRNAWWICLDCFPWCYMEE